MLSIFQAVLDEEGSLSRLIIDERDGMPSSSSYRHRFGSLLRTYSLIGYAPDRDYKYIEINRHIRDSLTRTLERNRSGSWAWRTSPCEASRIHKPSALVSFGLPNRLSFPIREHAMVPTDRGDKPRQGKRQGQAARRPDPPFWGMQCLQRPRHKVRNERNQRRARRRPMQHRRYWWPRKI